MGFMAEVISASFSLKNMESAILGVEVQFGLPGIFFRFVDFY